MCSAWIVTDVVSSSAVRSAEGQRSGCHHYPQNQVSTQHNQISIALLRLGYRAQVAALFLPALPLF
jgi:hypothetical protein